MNPHTPTLHTPSCHRSAILGLLGGLVSALLLPTTSHAALTDLSYSNQIETEAAIATQKIYDQLAPLCSDRTNGGCTGDILTVWNFVSEVVINGEDIRNGITRPNIDTPTPGSLGRPSALLLGRALQWCSGEEFTALGAQASSFTGGQITNLATRITSLRLGSSGLRIASNNYDFGAVPRGGGASGDELTSGWSGFVNGDYTKGSHDVTTTENAFDFRGRNFTVGVDKRINNTWAVGMIVGYQTQNLNFVDVLPGATVNVVDADGNSKGTSFLPYGLYQGDLWFFNASLGYQTMRFELNRKVNYGSGGMLPPGTITHNTTDTSSVHSHGWSSYESAGLSWRATPKFIIEPSLSIDWRHITIDSFTEADLTNAGFNFTVDEQRINSLEAIPALRMQYSFTPNYGVWTPYVDAQWHKQLHDQARSIRAVYADIASLVTDDAKFNIQTDAPDDSYMVYTAGFSAVLSGAQRGGLQVYGNYRWYQQLQNYSLHSVSVGLRYEF